MRLWLSCRESARLLSQRQDRAFSFGERTALRAHLMICRGCRHVDDQLAFLRQAVRALHDSDAAR